MEITAGARPRWVSVKAYVDFGPAAAMSQTPSSPRPCGPDVAGHAGEHGLGQLGDLAEQGQEVGGGAGGLEVGPGAEGVAGVGEDQGPDPWVRPGGGEGGAGRGDELCGEGVAVGRGVEGEGGDSGRRCDGHEWGHVSSGGGVRVRAGSSQGG